MENRKVYMDYNATTPVHPEVKKAVVDALDMFGNASSSHDFGRTTYKAIENARKSVASFINAGSDEIIFVGSGSEAGNTVLNLAACRKSTCALKGNRKAIVTTAIEHPCILETAKCLEEQGVPVFYLKVDRNGRIDLNQLEEYLKNENIAVVSVMMVNNEIGTIQDIRAIADLGHKYGALVHTDAVQAVGKIPVDVEALGVDFLSLSGHKIYAPKGIGALYIKRGTRYCALIRGGHQEKGRRAGTENTLGILAMGKAIECLQAEMDEDVKRLAKLKAKLRKGIEERIPDIRINGDQENCVSTTLNVSFPGAEGESILLYLDLEGIAVSTGSACSTGSLEPSHVLMAIGLGPELAHGSIRFSMGRETVEEDIDYVLEKLPPIIEKIRSMSSAYKGGK